MKKIYTFLLCYMAVPALYAQWTANTANNTLAATAGAADIQTANTSDGKTWIAFYSQRGSNYDMRAQLLDVQGNRLLGDSGMLVSDKRSGSATFVFNVCVDNNNNFIIAFQVQASFGYECGVQKLNTAGKLLWGEGVALGPGLSPYPVALSTNEIAVAWNNNGKINYQKVSPAGRAAWPAYKVFSGNSGHAVSRPQLLAGTNGKFNMIYQDQVAFPFYTNLFEQKFDNNGIAVWAKASKLSTLTTVSYRYYDVHMEKDTTYAGYYGNPSGSNRFDAYVQRVNPDGSLPWGANGSAFADYSGNNEPFEQTIYIAKQTGANNLWAVCTVTDPSQTASTVYVQKYNALTGSRLLGSNAKALQPLNNKLTSLAYSKLSLCGNEPLFLVTDNSNKLGAVKLNNAGNFAWKDSVTPVGTSRNTKSRYGFTDAINGQAVAVWQENKGSGDKPYAQPVYCNGTAGDAAPIAIAQVAKPGSTALSVRRIYPNPVQNMLTAGLVAAAKGSLQVYISDAAGAVIKQYHQSIAEGNNTIQLNVAGLKAGTYFMRLTNGKENAAISFNKQ